MNSVSQQKPLNRPSARRVQWQQHLNAHATSGLTQAAYYPAICRSLLAYAPSNQRRRISLSRRDETLSAMNVLRTISLPLWRPNYMSAPHRKPGLVW